VGIECNCFVGSKKKMTRKTDGKFNEAYRRGQSEYTENRTVSNSAQRPINLDCNFGEWDAG
jgi:hypothetical protein